MSAESSDSKGSSEEVDLSETASRNTLRRFSVNKPSPNMYRVVNVAPKSASGPPRKGSATLVDGDPTSVNQKFCSNSVSTTKYNKQTFIFVNLSEQFSRMANVYFLIISVLTALPISPKDHVSLIGTFVAVLMVSAVKEAYEDIQRDKSDQETNEQTATVVRGGKEMTVKWKEIMVGDVVIVRKDSPIPADMVLLSSTDEVHGLCFIDTCNIDGETNLKTMNSLEATKHVQTIDQINDTQIKVECENPNASLYTFSGSATIKGLKDMVSIGVSNVLLRGSTLRQTKEVRGVVIFTGHDTKLVMNATNAPFKVSFLMKAMNKCLALVFTFQALMCLTNTIIANSWREDFGSKMLYIQAFDGIEYKGKPLNEYNFSEELELGIGFIMEGYLTFLVAYSNLIPISLYVGLEIVKLFQVVLINSDLEIYHEETDTPTNARTSNLVEELGQVKFIFSDKTGTLTCNIMEFVCLSVNGKKYHITSNFENSTFLDASTFAAMKGQGDPNDHAAHEMFWRLLSVCHTVLAEYPDDKKGNMDVVKYQAASPDEAALVMAAKQLGYQFCMGTPVKYDIINIHEGTTEVWEILAVIEFTSTRKRMSVICKDPNGKIYLFCKGADNIIMERLGEGNKHMSDLAVTTQHLQDFAEIGLRTLCLSYKELSPTEYENFRERWHKASLDLTDRDKLQDEIAEEFETGLTLVGATAIEDKLQDGVPEAIETLAYAGIKLWVLTGDKQETAINIGFSCKLLTHDMRIHILSGALTTAELKQHIMQIMMQDVGKEENLDVKHAIVIDGATLTLALNEEVAKDFLEFGLQCDVCVCCRVSPKQKAEVVKLVKDNLTNPPVITLAIGDGANDVTMIQAAHIGIGISGQEGMQAVRSSDFSIAQFRFLVRLLLVHGSWAYKRVAKFILFYFYKNMANVMTEYWFAFQAGFSGQILFADWLSLGYNAVYTSFACIFGFCLDQDVSTKTIEKFPRLYEFSMYGEGFDMFKFGIWILIAFWHASACFYFPMKFMSETNAVDERGIQMGHWYHGTTSFFAVITVIHIRMGLMVYSWNWVVKLATFLSLAVFVISVIILCTKWMSTDMGWQPELLGMMMLLLGNPSFWLCILITNIVAILPDVIVKYVMTIYMPMPHNILHEVELGYSESGYKKPNVSQQVTPQ